MPIEITNIRIATDGREGLRFTVIRKDESHEFLLSREALDDLEGSNLQSEAALLAAFEKHRPAIERKAANALDYQYRAPEGGVILLQTRDF